MRLLFQAMVVVLCVFISGCAGVKSSVGLVGEKHHKVLETYEGYFYEATYTEKHVTQDTVRILSYNSMQPIQSIFLFDQGTCYYQKTRVFCSRCVERYMASLLNDRKYKFEKVDDVHYQSQKNKDILLKLSEHKENEEVCFEIELRNIAVIPN